MMMTKKRSANMINIINTCTGTGVIVKMHYFFLYALLHDGHRSNNQNLIIPLKKGLPKLWVGMEKGQKDKVAVNHNLAYSTSIAIVFGGYNAAFLCHCYFSFI